MNWSGVLIIVSVCIGGSVCASDEFGPRASQSLNQALKLLEQAREEALGISVHDASYKLDVMLGIAQVYNEMGEQALASGVLCEAEAFAVKLDRSELYGLLAVGQARAGYLKQALETVKKLPDQSGSSSAPRDYPHPDDLMSAKDTVLEIIIDEQLNKRDVKGALAAAAMSPEQIGGGRWQRDEEYRKIVLTQWRWGDVPEARRNIRLVRAGWVRDELLRDLVDLQLEAHDIEDACLLVKMVHYPTNKIPLLIKVAVAQANHGDKKGSKRSFEKAMTIASKLIDMKAQLFSEIKGLCDIAAGQTQAGDTLAQDTLQRAMKLAEPRIQSGSYADPVLSYLAITQARCGLLPKAFNTADSIKDLWRRADTFAQIATIQTEAGNSIDAIENFRRAGEIAGKITDSGVRDRTLLSVVEECSKSGQSGVGLQFAQRIELDSDREKALLKIVDWYASHGQVKKAEEVRNEIRINHCRRQANKSIIYAMVQAGNFSSAFEIARKIDGMEEGDVMQKLIEGQIKAGDFSGAALTARAWHTRGSTDTALGQVATAQARTGDLDGALSLVSDKDRTTIKAYIWLGVARGIVERIGSN